MSAAPLRLPLAGAVSLGAHAAFLALLALLLQPDDLHPQKLPRSAIEVAAHAVRQETAEETAPETTPQEPSGTAGRPIARGTIRTSTARPARPDARRLAHASTATAQVMKSAAAPGETLVATPAPAMRQNDILPASGRLPAIAPPAKTSLAGLAVAAEALPAAKAPAGRIASPAQIAGQPAAGIDSPTQVTLPVIADRGREAAALAPSPTRPDDLPPAGRTAPPEAISAVPGREERPAAARLASAATADRAAAVSGVPPAALPVAATLAWSGADTIVSDPLSLAAIESFMRPGDLRAGGTVRDGLTAALASVPCARLQTVFDPESGTLELRGHIPESGIRTPLMARLRAEIGTSIPVADRLQILPRPQCAVLTGIANAGLPQSTDQITNPRIVGQDSHVREFRYVSGQRLEMDLTAPDYDAFVYVDYFDAQGQVLHLQPNAIVPLAISPARSTLSPGRSTGERPALDLTIGPPFGQEIVVAFAASDPLYEGLRPIGEPAGPYLDFLKQRIAGARRTHPGFKGEWVYFLVSTRPGQTGGHTD
ncbi:DUF4384 domain-containing protein [Tropicimonas sp.]|uniref:DUF4384 domain-containing protein n=1 Tax=Tropicimonas sp. TaxID=2067044 RepID=UPI003A83CD74